MNDDMVNYYRERALEYEKIYDKPERQDDLKKAADYLAACFEGERVLEIACGTGYWTERIALKAASVFATDINESVLEVARSKKYVNNNVSFAPMDMNEIGNEERYNSVFGGFIFSHIKKNEVDKFLLKLHRSLVPGGKVVLIDNNFVEGSNTPLSFVDESGNSYQKRELKDGNSYTVLKNYPAGEELRETANRIGAKSEYVRLNYFWILTLVYK